MRVCTDTKLFVSKTSRHTDTPTTCVTERRRRRRWIVFFTIFWLSQTRAGNPDPPEERTNGVPGVRSSASRVEDLPLQWEVQERAPSTRARAWCGCLHTVYRQRDTLDPPCPQGTQSVPATWSRQGPRHRPWPVLHCSAAHGAPGCCRFSGGSRSGKEGQFYTIHEAKKNRFSQMTFQNGGG